MTSPVTPALAPSARAATGAEASASSTSAGPFASALDGAISAGRPEVDGSGPDSEQQGREEPAEGAVPTLVADLPATPAGGLVAALWARLTGTAGDAPPTTGDVPSVPGNAPGAAGATGRAHALEVAGGAAHGLRALPGAGPAGGLALGTATGKPGAGTAAPAAPLPAAPGTPAPAVPGSTAPLPPPPTTATDDAVAALAAAGVQVVAVTTGGTGATAGPALLAPAAPAPTPAAPLADTGSTPSPAGPDAGTAPGAVAPAAAPSGGGDGSGAEQRPSDDAPDGAAPVTGGGGAPAPSAVSAAPRVEAATGAAVAEPVAGQLARSVAVLRGGPDGAHTLTVVLAPEALGPVEVSVTLSQGSVELTLRGAHEHGRAALIDALPDLRRDLEAAGLTCSRVEVDRGGREGSWSGSQSSTSSSAGGREGGGRGPQQEHGDTGARPWHRPADNEGGHPARTRGVSGLDVRV